NRHNPYTSWHKGRCHCWINYNSSHLLGIFHQLRADGFCLVWLWYVGYLRRTHHILWDPISQGNRWFHDLWYCLSICFYSFGRYACYFHLWKYLAICRIRLRSWAKAGGADNGEHPQDDGFLWSWRTSL